MKKNITKKILSTLLMLPLLAMSFPALAIPLPQYNVSGVYVVGLEYQSIIYPHDMTLAQDGLGNLTGNGGSPASANTYLWTITSGTVYGNTINLTADYTATQDAVTPLTTMTMTGTIAQNGTMSGTWSDNYQGGARSGTWSTTSGNATALGTLNAEDFGVMDASGVKGYTAGFGLTDATFDQATSVAVQLFSGTTLLQTNTAIIAKFNTDITGTQFSSPFDVSGTFDYVTDGYWTNVRQTEYGQNVSATRVTATVTLANGKIVTAENTNLTGDPATVFIPGSQISLVNLLSAENFAILSQTGITNTGSHTTSITGNIGSSATTAASMNTIFCSEITGTIYGVDAGYVGSGDQTCFAGNPPLSNKTLVDNAVLDMQTAYIDASGRTNPTATELGAGNIGGITFAPGLYKWSTDVNIPTNITLSGSASDVWIFQISGNLNIASEGSVPSGIKVLLAGGAKAENIFWQVGGETGATLGTYSTFEGNILTAKQIIIQTGAVLNGRALAQTQVALDGNIVTSPLIPIVANVVTNTATTITSIDATLNGTNGNASAIGHSFWVSLSPFVTTSSTIPSGVYSTPDLGAIGANVPFSASLLSVTTTGVPSNLPAITAGTTYYFSAWSNIGGTWYPGEVLSFATLESEGSNNEGEVGGEVTQGVGVLNVTSVTSTKTTSTADGTFAGGWIYTFHVTLPTNEPNLAMKFADWIGVPSGTIPTANNVRISSTQASNPATVLLTGAGIYSTPKLNMVSDLNPLVAGMQVDVIVEVSVPVGTVASFYTSAYGVQTTP
ncbi:MAG: hypothetical protein A2312_01245 [Candidatus Staskawiczbacteria bacterium RIFOXYB2_FULL_32_9]|uniref:DUF3494 domain-containing protein n=1 Tax=Candidatus Staskawiczbacteria bacterium RIFOXYD1_FULL_32_13 TaxID=1802234 RepID=A0A1G2JRI7_9BACT|nr:MAG: hypothetical protein UR22_C0003G0035 [Parcubacteria group bacterium GW2011_GWC2_32_10]OGZ78368.1 MAG: hypothetical protein A2360_03555 [Candidatus Staskawiczbacteria bacterium RIFOXYB1_FULL_32_11]OGZ80740.1 MAG: hypothetical protein A2256_02045 [Candidatus Staskawiczbacteria bacterium RIFOXYA2_FULL_32_7]OGZ81341.1 MAG: hypothetical protein A2312_01245 [Candidatus Staskawiczbacteria bacterium RIFOXYB2_FULL_32_9]OGZ86730.1 MAG: hypothetical protein A2463_03790 [Candidatus Staskawiczbacter